MFEFWLLTKSWNHLSFVNISPTLVIDTSTERSLRVLHHGNPKIWFFSSKKFEIEFDLYFDLCWRAEILQVGLNMHLYVDIRDASSSLWGSTSSFIYVFCTYMAIYIYPWIRKENASLFLNNGHSLFSSDFKLKTSACTYSLGFLSISISLRQYKTVC